MNAYKIRNKKTGLFARGGYYGGWSKIGKTWSTAGHLRAHINMVGAKHYGADCEVVILCISEGGTQSVQDFAAKK